MRSVRVALILIGLSIGSAPASAYSVLAHEAAVDAVWESGLRPLLLHRFPRTSPEALTCARAYAYGGSVIQDLGYYPFGNHFFSNLLHYVRSGDFVETLIREAGDVDEYAFALGALAHYANDNTGHPLAVNRSVPVFYPRLRQKYGNEITYVEAPKEHVIVEFSFDVVQAAGGAYLPDAYRRFIGFQVATPLLERAFRETYGLDMKNIFLDEERAIGTFRYAVSQIVPTITAEAWRDKRDDIAKLIPGVARSGFVFAFNRADYERAFGGNYQKPGLMARFVGFLYRLVPKVGPLKPLSFKAPTPATERLFAESFREARERYSAALAQAVKGPLELRNTDFDTGKAAAHGEYALADDTYAEILDRLSAGGFAGTPRAMRQNIRDFYGRHARPSSVSKNDRKHWAQIQRALDALPD